MALFVHDLLAVYGPTQTGARLGREVGYGSQTGHGPGRLGLPAEIPAGLGIWDGSSLSFNSQVFYKCAAKNIIL